MKKFFVPIISRKQLKMANIWCINRCNDLHLSKTTEAAIVHEIATAVRNVHSIYNTQVKSIKVEPFLVRTLSVIPNVNLAPEKSKLSLGSNVTVELPLWYGH